MKKALLFLLPLATTLFCSCSTSDEIAFTDTKESSPEFEESKADREIVKRIRQALLEDNTLPHHISNAIKITSIDGVVTLEGIVPKKEMKNTIETTAKQIPGVQSVNNRLEVKTPLGT